MEHCFFVKQNVQIPFQFKIACATAGALWVLVVRRKFLLRMYEAQTYIISFVIFLCPPTSHLVATLISSQTVLLSHSSLLPFWPVKNQRFN